MMTPICIVPWNSKKWTDYFIAQVREKTKAPYRIYISDNSDAPYQPKGADIEYWWNGGNIGYARAMNRAIRNTSSDVMVFSNEDVTLSQGWLKPLLVAYQESDFPMIAPITDTCLRKTPPPSGAKGLIPWGLIIPAAVRVTSKSRMFDPLGYFDERFYPLGCSDQYLCWRIWASGQDVGLHVDVPVDHKKKQIILSNISVEKYKEIEKEQMALLRQIYGEAYVAGKPKEIPRGCGE